MDLPENRPDQSVRKNRKNRARIGESGNIFFTLFGAVALVGVIGAATTTLMRGPVGTVMTLNQKAKVDSQLQIARKLVALESTEVADCDGDNFLEPLAPDTTGACDDIVGVGSGCLPATVGAAKKDAWGTSIGYCGWNHGSIVAGCADRYQGENETSKTVLAVISAGPNRVFDASCADTPGYVTAGGDDIIFEWTYEEAGEGLGGGLWSVKSGTNDWITTDKNVEISNDATFASGTTATFEGSSSFSSGSTAAFGSGSTLDFAGGGLLNLPRDGACSAANDGMLQINTTGANYALELCESGTGWLAIGGGAVSAVGADGNIQFAEGGVMQSDNNLNWDNAGDSLDITGALSTTGAVDFGGTMNVDGNISDSDSDVTVADGFNVTGVTDLDGTLNVDGAADLNSTLNVDGVTDINANLNVVGGATAVDFDGTLNVDGNTVLGGTLSVAGDISDPDSDVTVADSFNVTGAGDFDSTLNIDGNASADSYLLDGVAGSVGMYGDGTGILLSTGGSGTNHFVMDSSGEIGIGVASPATKLDVSGAIKVGNESAACTGSLAGAIRYVSGDLLEVCSSDTSNWESIGTSGGGGGGTGGKWDDAATGSDIKYTDGDVGIKVNDPLASLHVSGNVIFGSGDFMVSGTYTGAASVPETGAGTRMFFDQESAALRSGYVSGTQWDDANIGTYSVALGQDVRATGSSSTALGFSTLAQGSAAFAVGSGTKAIGGASTALGKEVTASGTGSVAVGLFDGSQATDPVVSGNRSYGIFMGAGVDSQSGVDVTANDILALMGGKMLINPDSPTNTEVTTSNTLALDVEGGVGATQFCDETGINCFTAADIVGGGTGVFEDVSDTIRATSGIINYASADFVFGSPQLADTGNADHDARMFFDKSKGAFRAGAQTGPWWDEANRGDYSIGLGNTIYAGGLNGIAIGNLVGAGGTNSMALGTEVDSNGSYSLAIGLGTATSGAQDPKVTGNNSFGIFMNDQSDVDITASSVMALLGGRFVIDPNVAATQTNVSTGDQQLELDVEGDIGAINFCDEAGNNCFTATDVAGGNTGVFEDVSGTGAGPIRFRSGTINYWLADFVVGSPQLDDDGDTQHDIRMYFDKAKGAFRAGRAQSTQWDDANTGSDSFAVGLNTTASGGQSVAMGYDTTASNWYSTAIGDSTTASGATSFAAGGSSVASGNMSVAMGASTTASGYASTALGSNTTASGDYSIAIGEDPSAAGWASISLGAQTSSTQDYGVSIGLNANSTAAQATAIGADVTASGTNALAMGEEVNANGASSMAFGLSTANQATDPMVSGARSFAIFMDGGVLNSNSTKNITGNDLFALVGGRALIDPTRNEVNVSTGAQQLELDVEGDIGAINFCDEDGNNCFTAAGIAGGSLGAPGNDREIVFNSGNSLGTDTNFVFSSAGKFGIGTASPTEFMHVKNANNTWTRLLLENTSAAGTVGDSQLILKTRNSYFSVGANDDTNFFGIVDENVGWSAGARLGIDGSGNFIVGSYQTDDTGSTAQDKRMFFDKTKAAFRAGVVTGTEWDDVNVGTASFAVGDNTTASGIGSFASGDSTTASGWLASAFGSGTTASGDYSLAAGESTRAISDGALAVGFDTEAGYYAAAIGYSNTASNSYAFATGRNTTASGFISTAHGYYTTASGDQSTALGSEAEAAGENSVAFGLINGSQATDPKVSGDRSFGIFMGAGANSQSAVDMTATDTFGLFGGKMVIDPSAPATQLSARATLDLGAATDALIVPIGNDTTERPASPIAGMIRFNSNASGIEYYNGSQWNSLAACSGNCSGDSGVLGDAANNTAPHRDGDANTGFYSDAASTVSVAANARRAMRWNTVTNAVNYFDVTPSATGSAPILAAAGTDTNIGLTINPKGTGGITLGGTAALTLPAGLDADRPGSPVAGMIRYNSTSDVFEGYIQGTGWDTFASAAAAAGALNDLSDVITDYTGGVESMYLGQNSGAAITTGDYNTYLGYNAGTSTTTGRVNTFIGQRAGESNNDGAENVYLGANAGRSNASGNYNTFLGTAAGWYSTSSNNTMIGYLAGKANSGSEMTGGDNTAIGSNAALNLTSGQESVFIGKAAGRDITTGSWNTMVGNAAGFAKTGTAAQNTYLGNFTGANSGAASYVTAIGAEAGRYATANNNTFVGWQSGRAASGSELTGDDNTFVGYQTGLVTTSGADNTFIGDSVGIANTTGFENTAIGSGALDSNTTGYRNTAIGFLALYANTTARDNVAVGKDAMRSNTTGQQNVGVGTGVMFNNDSGSYNVAMGDMTLYENTTGGDNTAIGTTALHDNTTGSANVGLGHYALFKNTQGWRNVAVGHGALRFYNTTSTSSAYNTAIGADALGGVDTVTDGIENTGLGGKAGQGITTGDGNIFLGFQAGDSITTGSTNILLGYDVDAPTATTSNYLNIGGSIYGDMATGDITIAGVGALTVPAGLDGDRPGSPVAGMIRYNSTSDVFEGYIEGTGWDTFSSASGGVTWPQDIAGETVIFSSGGSNVFYLDADSNLALGEAAFSSNTTGLVNQAIGHSALHDNTSGNFNTGSGYYALFNNTTGSNNTAFGYRSLNTNKAKSNNTAIGYGAMLYADDTTTASDSNNTAVGYRALRGSTTSGNNTGIENTAIGADAALNLTSQTGTVAVGYMAQGSASSSNATAVGAYAARDLASGRGVYIGFEAGMKASASGDSVMIGAEAGRGNVNATGINNTFVGGQAGRMLADGQGNVLMGMNAGYYITDGDYNTGIGRGALYSITTGNDNTTLGQSTGSTLTTGSGNILIGKDIDTAAATTNYYLNIGHTIFGDMGTNTVTPGAGDASITIDGNLTIGGTGALTLPVGDDAQRPTGVAGMIRFSSQTNTFEGYDGSAWGSLGSGGGGAINDLSDAYTDYVTDFNMYMGDSAGTPTSPGQYNIAIGQNALNSLDGTCGGASECDQHIAIGMNALTANTTGINNIAIGYLALRDNTTGDFNAAISTYALTNNTTGSRNIAFGRGALMQNTTASDNVAIAYNALGYTTTGGQNTAIGVYALYENRANSVSTAIGYEAMRYADDTTTGAATSNTAVGYRALRGSTTAANNTGTGNTAMGANALRDNTTGSNNVAIGNSAGIANTTGSANVFIGDSAGNVNTSGLNNVMIGHYSGEYNTTGSENVFVGRSAGYSNSTGGKSVIVGHWAGVYATANDNTFVGYKAGTASLGNELTGTDNTFLGFQTGMVTTSGAANTFIGDNAGAANSTGSRNIMIGAGTDAPTATTSDYLNIGDSIYGDMATGNITIAGTAALTLPAGLDGDRPTGVAGMIRFNSTSTSFEGHDGTSWGSLGGGTITIDTVTGEPAPTGMAIDDLSDVAITSATNGECLTYNGSAWVDGSCGGGSGLWTAGAGEDIYYTNAGAEQVGIGTTNPTETLHVYRNSNAFNILKVENASAAGTVGDVILQLTTRSSDFSFLANDDTNQFYFIDENVGWPSGVRYTIDSSGNFGIGTNTPDYIFTVSGSNKDIAHYSYSSTANAGPDFEFKRAYGSEGTPTAVASGAKVGGSRFYGYDGSAFHARALMEVQVNGTVDDGTNAVPMDILFRTGSTTAYGVERLRIFSDGNIGVGDFSADTADSTLHVQSGDIRLDGGAGNQAGCIRFDDSTDKMQFSHDCSTFTDMAGGGAIALPIDVQSDVEIMELNAAGETFMRHLNADRSIAFGAQAGAAMADVNDAWLNTFIGDTAGTATTTGDYNVFVGADAGPANTTGSINVFIGEGAGYSNVSGTTNTFVGSSAGRENVSGAANTLIGRYAGKAVTGNGHTIVGFESGYNMSGTPGSVMMGSQAGYYATAGRNTLIGFQAGYSNGTDFLTGIANTFVGYQTGYSNTTGQHNSFFGDDTGYSNTTGSDNTFIGDSAGWANVDGNNNTALGAFALDTNTSGSGNIAIGRDALTANTTGIYNVAVGPYAGVNLTTVEGNTIMGAYAGQYATAEKNTILGYQAGMGSAGFGLSGIDNTFVGYKAGVVTTSGKENTFIGDDAGYLNTAGQSNTFIGKSAGGENTTGDRNVVIGTYAGDVVMQTGDYNILIGYAVETPTSSTSNYLNIGNTIIGDMGTNPATPSTGDASITIDGDLTITGTCTGCAGGGISWPQDIAGETVIFSSGAANFMYVDTSNNFAIGEGNGGGLTSGTGNTMAGHDSGANITTGSSNTIFGTEAGQNLTTGSMNTYIGLHAGQSDTTATGDGNTAVGMNALDDISTGGSNTAIGRYASQMLTTGIENVAVGNHAMGLTAAYQSVAVGNNAAKNNATNRNVYVGWKAGEFATSGNNVAIGSQSGGGDGVTAPTGSHNTFVGNYTALNLTTGNDNTFVGHNTGYSNTTGDNNVFIGQEAGYTNNAQSASTAVGFEAMRYTNDTATAADSLNTALGYRALRGSTTAANNTGKWNTAVGANAGIYNTTGYNNAFFGTGAGDSNTTGYSNTLIGKSAGQAITTGGGNVIVGQNVGNALVTGDFNILLGKDGTVDVPTSSTSNYLNIGNSIYGDMATGTITIAGTGALTLPAGLDADRPGTAVAGMIRFNSTSTAFEGYDGSSWGSLGSGGGGGGAIDDLSDAITDYAKNNMFVGQTAGNGTATGTNNTALGETAMSALTSGVDSTAVGYQALVDNAAGDYNTAFGSGALRTNVARRYNTAIGYAAMYYANSSPAYGNSENTAMGAYALRGSTSAANNFGTDNSAFGYGALGANTGGSNNVAIGHSAGSSNTSGSGNILIGASVNAPTATTSNHLNIGNTIYANLSSDDVGIGQVPDSGIELDVLGDIEYTGTITDVSDRRLKTDIVPLEADDIMGRLAQLGTYSFRMKDDVEGKTELGVMAQEVIEVFPELVRISDDEMGTMSVNYVGFIAPLIEASKSLQEENAALKAELAQVKADQDTRLAALEADMKGLKAHTGYGISKAQIGLWMLLGMGGSAMFFFGLQALARRRQQTTN